MTTDFNVEEQRAHARQWLKELAHAEDNGRPGLGVAYAEFRDELEALQVFGLITVDDVADTISVTTAGRAFAGLISTDIPDIVVQAATVRGDVLERELAARYIDAKVSGIERYMRENPHVREHGDQPDGALWIVRILQAIANEFRQGMHVPAVMIEGRVIPYNDTNDTGIKHAANLATFFADVHERNVRAGWWSEITTGDPKKRSPGELFMLMVTEMAEAYDAWLTGEADDKLPHFPGIGVEMGDLGIRWADFCGALMAGRIIRPDPANNPGDRMFRDIVDIARQYEAIRKTPAAVGELETADFLHPMDVATMIDEKLAFNAQREDHKIENRLKDDGKRT